jgi:hypothetical protein
MIELMTAQEGRDNLSVANITPMNPQEAGVFEGAITSPFVGVKHAWDVGAVGLADAVMPTLEKYTPEAASDWFKEQRAVAYNSMKETRADPMNMGAVAQVGHALGSVLTMGLAGGLIAGPAGAAAAIGGGSMFDKYNELRDQNVDRETALDVAGVTGAVMAVGSALPAFMGKTLTTQILSGIGMNVPLGMVERGGSSELLENAGYSEMAQHYKALDGAAIAVDMVLGAAFPIGARALRRNVPLAEMDSSMDANRTIANDNVHPALPGTLEDAAAVKAAEDSFAKQLLEDGKSLEEIDIPRNLYENAVENPAVAKATAETVSSFDDLAAKEGYVPLNKMESDVDSMGRAYAEVQAEKDTVQVLPEKPVEVKAEGEKVDTYTSDRASNIIAQIDGMTVVDDNGQVVKASDLVAKSEEQFKQEQKEIDLYKVAVECAVRVGT